MEYNWFLIDFIKMLKNPFCQFLFGIDTVSPKHLFGNLTEKVLNQVQPGTWVGVNTKSNLLFGVVTSLRHRIVLLIVPIRFSNEFSHL